MNRISCFSFISFLIFSTALYSQHLKKFATAVHVTENSITKSPTDTLKPSSFVSGTPVLYAFIDGGYCFGNNPMHDRVFAQKYLVPQSYLVHGVALRIGAKEIIGTADTVTVSFYRLEGPGTDTSGAVNNAPDTAFQSLKITTGMIDTSGLTFVMFPDSFIVYNDFAVGIDISAMEDDTIGLVTSTDGDAMESQLSWGEWSNHTWHSILEPMNWGMDLDFGIFIVADMSSADIHDDYFIDGIKLGQNQPNPSSGYTLIQYELMNNAENVTLEIYDMSGKQILTLNEGEQLSGLHQISLQNENIVSGVYYYSLNADNQRLTKRMVISR